MPVFSFKKPATARHFNLHIPENTKYFLDANYGNDPSLDAQLSVYPLEDFSFFLDVPASNSIYFTNP